MLVAIKFLKFILVKTARAKRTRIELIGIYVHVCHFFARIIQQKEREIFALFESHKKMRSVEMKRMKRDGLIV
jgi:hypothetical protein